jgi:hypothetical protein
VQVFNSKRAFCYVIVLLHSTFRTPYYIQHNVFTFNIHSSIPHLHSTFHIYNPYYRLRVKQSVRVVRGVRGVRGVTWYSLHGIGSQVPRFGFGFSPHPTAIYGHIWIMDIWTYIDIYGLWIYGLWIYGLWIYGYIWIMDIIPKNINYFICSFSLFSFVHLFIVHHPTIPS